MLSTVEGDKGQVVLGAHLGDQRVVDVAAEVELDSAGNDCRDGGRASLAERVPDPSANGLTTAVAVARRLSEGARSWANVSATTIAGSRMSATRWRRLSAWC